MTNGITSSQTIGPFPHEGWRWAAELSQQGAVGAGLVTISGVLYDGQGAPVSDGWVEAWTPAAAPVEHERPLPGFRRCATGEQGEFRLELSAAPRPGEPVAWIALFARGLLKHQFCAVFLADAPGLANSELLAQVPAARRDTLIAQRQADGSYRWDIHLQGERETVFLDFT
ncbi:protocatechuate 3,4-dioxygenase [Rhizobacter sp. SG703]|uniref:protocatechuate 3,4-dioxygenase n=1 Tax=Rhizobacter sp. SG703 TaxID=2587140 RepID=UPI001445F283|nr:protocatechuate 3,4-dioxygenase [Rhizobacter sp. SG703]NKI97305.1 protocatechuate 3,4-dioxygenase alpha subunit [Rhizobacter sp. SG703]